MVRRAAARASPRRPPLCACDPLPQLPAARFRSGFHAWSSKAKGVFFNEREAAAAAAAAAADADPSARRYHYCSLPLGTLPQGLASTLADLGALPSPRSESKGGLWLASAGVKATMHFDTAPNILTQLKGTKRVLLVAPQYWRELYLFSPLHPAARQTQVPQAAANAGAVPGEGHDRIGARGVIHETSPPPMEGTDDCGGGGGADDAAAAAAAAVAARLRLRFPRFGSAFFEEVVLEPGDQLYIPPFHFHSVEVLGNQSAASTNVYLDAPHKASLAHLFALEPPAPSAAADADAAVGVGVGVLGDADGETGANANAERGAGVGAEAASKATAAACFLVRALEVVSGRGCCGGPDYALTPVDIVRGILGRPTCP